MLEKVERKVVSWLWDRSSSFVFCSESSLPTKRRGGGGGGGGRDGASDAALRSHSAGHRAPSPPRCTLDCSPGEEHTGPCMVQHKTKEAHVDHRSVGVW